MLKGMTTPKSDLKTVIITGGSSGIGYESAKVLLETGLYRLVLMGRTRNKLEEAAQSLQSNNVSVSVCDLKDSDAILKSIQKIEAQYKGIFGLVNNAGVYPFGGISTTSEQSWDDCFDVNLKAPFLLTQGVVKSMARSREGGRIVNISSTAGLLPNHFALAYSVSKAAMIQLTKTLAKELGTNNITVNCICPGIVRSPLHEAYHASRSELEEFYARRGSAFPLGRVGEPKDVAGAVKFFLSEDASWVTGDTFIVDGGRLLL